LRLQFRLGDTAAVVFKNGKRVEEMLKNGQKLSGKQVEKEVSDEIEEKVMAELIQFVKEGNKRADRAVVHEHSIRERGK
jgi:hypothetical protein